MARVACTVMLKNEGPLVTPFLTYHSALFGPGNLFVIDNGSTDAETLNALARWEGTGGKVERGFALPEHFQSKGKIIADLVRRLDQEGEHDLYILLDCDEFVAVRSGDGYSCDPAEIHAVLDNMVGGDRVFRVGTNLSNVPGRPGIFQVAEYSKAIFAKDTIGGVDHGFHGGWTRDGSQEAMPCPVVYVHFHYRPYEDIVRASRQKLLLQMPPEDLEDPEKLRAFKGRGWHLVGNLLAGPDGYYAQFRNIRSSYAFPTLVERFREVGAPMPFSDFSLPDDPAASSRITVMVDEATTSRIRGWAWDPGTPTVSTRLAFAIDGRQVWSGSCDQPRPDVHDSGIPTEAVGFNVAILGAVAPGAVLTVSDADGLEMKLVVAGRVRDTLSLADADAGRGQDGTGEVHGHVDSFRNGRIQGWVLRSVATPEGKRLLGTCTVGLLHGGQLVGRTIASIPRPDVAQAMNSDDRCGFLIEVPREMPTAAGYAFRLAVMPENWEIPGSPCIAAPSFPKMGTAR